MRPYLKYISKQFSRLILLLCGLAVINVFIFFTFFYKIVKTDYTIFIHTNDESLSKPHYFEALDERLDLRHGLGLIIFKLIIEAHGGTVDTPEVSTGYKTILSF